MTTHRPTRTCPSLTDLRNALSESFPVLDDDAQRISLALYRALAEGHPVDLAELAVQPGLPDADTIRAVVDDWPAVYRDDDGRVVGFWGLALGGTSHRIEVRGVRLTTWCAWDTLFLPEILGAEVRVESPCPVTGLTVQMVVGPAGIESVDPKSPALSFLDPTGKVGDGVISAFCHHIHFFADRAAGETWRADRPDALLLTLDEAWELASAANQARYPSLCGVS